MTINHSPIRTNAKMLQNGELVTIQGVSAAIAGASKVTLSQKATPVRLSYDIVGTTTPFSATIVSSDINDTVAGTRARTVTIEGLDANGVPVTRTVNLNGTTPVNITGTWQFIHKAYVTAHGTGVSGKLNSNLGEITISSGGSVILTIATQANRSADAIYRVPFNASMRLFSLSWLTPDATVYYTNRLELSTYNVNTQPNANMMFELQPIQTLQTLPLEVWLPAGTIVELSYYRFSGTGNNVQAYLQGHLVPTLDLL